MNNETLDKAASITTDPKSLKRISDACTIAGFVSIGLSIASWGFRRATANEGHAERLGIFVGMWAPTFFILGQRAEKYAERLEREAGSKLQP